MGASVSLFLSSSKLSCHFSIQVNLASLVDNSHRGLENILKFLNESPIKTCMSKELSYLLYRGWWWKLENKFHFGFVDLNPFFGYYVDLVLFLVTL